MARKIPKMTKSRENFIKRMDSGELVHVDSLPPARRRRVRKMLDAFQEAFKGNYEPGIKLGLFTKDIGKNA